MLRTGEGSVAQGHRQWIGSLGIWIFRGGNRPDRDGLGWSEVEKTQKRCLSLPTSCMDHQVSLGSILSFPLAKFVVLWIRQSRSETGQLRLSSSIIFIFTFHIPIPIPTSHVSSSLHPDQVPHYSILVLSHHLVTSPSECGILFREHLALVQSRPSP